MNKIESEILAKLKNFEVGARFKQLAIKHKKDAPGYWVKVLGLNHRNQVYHRWSSNDLESKEIIMICEDLKISISEFYDLKESSNIVNDFTMSVPKKPYIEDQIAELQSQVAELQKHYQIRQRQ